MVRLFLLTVCNIGNFAVREMGIKDVVISSLSIENVKNSWLILNVRVSSKNRWDSDTIGFKFLVVINGSLRSVNCHDIPNRLGQQHSLGPPTVSKSFPL